jgi:phospholipid/cholesterol/gamma-HCH transport system substrate-binding protein
MSGRNWPEVLTGAVIIVVAAGFFGYAVANSGRDAGGGYTLNAQYFDHIDGLNIGADVRIAGVKVGSITATRLDPKFYQAVVTFSVKDGIQIPNDSSAEISSDGLLGGKYLDVTPGGDSTILKPGQAITTVRGTVNLEQLLSKFVFSSASAATGAHPAAPDRSPPSGGDQGAKP